jgi:hypothetical protein
MNIKGTLKRRLGLIVSIVAIIGALALAVAASAATARTASSRAGHTTTAASNKRIVLAFLRDVLAEHHGSRAITSKTTASGGYEALGLRRAQPRA